MYTSEVKKSNSSLFLENLITVGGATAISKTLVAPLERIKVILQAPIYSLFDLEKLRK